MMIKNPSNNTSGPFVVPTSEHPDPWQMNAGAMSKLEVSSSSDGSEDGDNAIDVDRFSPRKVVDVDSFVLSCDPTTAKQSQVVLADDSSNTADESCSLISFGSTKEEEEEEVAPAMVGRRAVRSSIKLSSLQAEIPVKTHRGSWMNLPQPDMAKIRQSSESTLSTYLEDEDDDASKPEQRGVAFTTVTVRCYDQTIGDNPSVSYGPPIQLDWKYEEEEPISVQDFEDKRPPRCELKNMALSYYRRMDILQKEGGHSEKDLRQARRRASSDKFKRGVTRYFLPYQLLEDAVESSVRKTKRALQRKTAV